MRRILSGAVVVLLITGCGSDDERQAAAGEPTATPGAEQAEAPEPTPKGFFATGTIQFKIVDVAVRDDLPVKDGEDVPAGASFVVVQTKIRNVADTPLDAACGGVIHAEILDADLKVHPSKVPVAALRGNPDCPGPTAPGEVTDVTFAIAVPEGTEPSAFALRDDSNPDRKAMLHTVRIE